MDLPVVLIKLRDYIFWFGPAYLVAIGLGAASELLIRHFLALPAEEAPKRPAKRPGQPGEPPDNIPSVRSNLFLESWLRLGMGRRSVFQQLPEHVSLPLYIWASIVSPSASWLAVIVTAQLSWALAIARLGLALIMASLLAALVPFVVRGRDEVRLLSRGEVGVAETNETGLPRYSAHLRQWGRAFQRRFAETSDGFLLAAGLGAVLFGLGPGLYSILHETLAGPLSYLLDSIVGVALPIVPGADAPLVAALQVKGTDAGGLVAIMLTISATPWSLLRDLKAALGTRATLAYLGAVLLLAATLAWLVSPMFASVGVL